MIFQYTQLDNSLAYLDLFLWIMVVTITYLIAFYTVLKFLSNKEEMEKYQKYNIITWVLFLIFLGIANTLNIIWRFTISDTNLAKDIEFLSQIFVYIAFFIKIYNIEKSINHSQFYKGFYFTILELIAIIIGIVIYPFITEIGPIQTIYLIFMIAGFAVFPGIFIYMTVKSTGAARIKALRVVVGAMLIGGGMLIQPQNAESYVADMPNYEIMIILLTISCSSFIILGVMSIFLSYRDTL